MTFTPQIQDGDVQSVTGWMAGSVDTKSVTLFKPGPGMQRLALKFDITKRRDDTLAYARVTE